MRSLLILSALMVAGCDVVRESPGETAERNISRDLASQFGGIDVAPAANCVRDHASESELAILSSENIATAPLTREIFERAETLECLQANGVIEVLDIVEVVE